LQLDKDSTEAFKSGAYIDLVIANSGEVDYDEVSDAVVAHSSVLRIYYYANYNAMYFAYQNDNNGTLMWLPSDGTSALYTQWANDFVAGRKVYINYQFKDVYEQVDGEWYFAHLEFTMYCGVEGENGEIVWLKEGCLYYPGQNCWIVADDGETYPENDASHLGHTMKTKQYVYGGYKVKDGYVFIGGGSKADFKLTISDLSFTTTVTSETATAETLPAWTAAQTNE
jgi:hypothetical protein